MANGMSPLDMLTEAKEAIDKVIEQDIRPSPETLARLFELTIALQLELQAHEGDPGPVY